MDRPDDHLAICDLIARYAWALDEGDVVTLATLFVEDADFDLQPRDHEPDLPFPAHGSEQIAATIGSARKPGQQRRHLMSNIRVTFAGEAEATAVSYVTIIQTTAGQAQSFVALMGQYTDEVRRSDDGTWRFKSRLIVHDIPKSD